MVCMFSEVKTPISILGAEVDMLSPPELVKQFEQILSGKTEVRISKISWNTWALCCIFYLGLVMDTHHLSTVEA